MEISLPNGKFCDSPCVEEFELRNSSGQTKYLPQIRQAKNVTDLTYKYVF